MPAAQAWRRSGAARLALWLGLLLSGSLASAAWAQAGARCFVVPLAGAAATVAGQPVTGPQVSDRCRELRVQAGAVQLVYTGAQGEPMGETVAAGAQPVLAGLARSSEAFDGVQRLLTLGVRDISAASGGSKQYSALAYTPSSFGAPFGELWVPPDGLRFRLYLPKPAPGQAPLVVQEVDVRIAAGGQTVYLGRVNLGLEVSVPAAVLAPGARYTVQLRVQTGEGTLDLRGDFTVLEAARSQDIGAALARLQAAGLHDGPAAAIARSLVFEDDALGFNSRQNMLKVKP